MPGTRALLLAGSLTLAACGAAEDSGPPADDTPTKAEIASISSGKADGFDWCAHLGWYGDGICDTFCVNPDPDCEAPSPAADDPDAWEWDTDTDTEPDPEPQPEPDPEPAPEPACDPFGPIACAISCRDSASWPQAWVDFEDEVIALVNQKRASGADCGTNGWFGPSEPLTDASPLAEAARCHSSDLASNALFSHTGSDGSTFSTRALDAGYEGFATAENIAAGYSTAQAVVNGWMTSDGHCKNIMAASPDEIGVGLRFQSGSTYSYYWTMVTGEAP